LYGHPRLSTKRKSIRLHIAILEFNREHMLAYPARLSNQLVETLLADYSWTTGPASYAGHHQPGMGPENALSFARDIGSTQSDLAAPPLWRACLDFFKR
jgi:hypothetical protein